MQAQQDALAQFYGSAGQAQSQTETNYPGLVYLGRGPVAPTDAHARQLRAQGLDPSVSGWSTGDRFVTGETAVYEFNQWSARRRADFIAQAKLSGLIPADGGQIEAARLWRTLVEEASYYNPVGSSDRRKISPWDILSSYVRQSGVSEGGWARDPSNPDFEINRLTGERRYVGPRFKTQTDTAVNLTDPATAKALATSAFQQLMGRDPGTGELSAFAEALRAAETAAPVTQTTTTEHDPVTGEIIGTNSVASGGLDSAGKQYLAEQKVKNTKEYAVVQAGTTYENALEQMVFGSPSLGA
ncbi:hypothetical protein [Streptomyces sp. URMC 129]|uniref:hypothetical protein n=1 Tax=Streptomyces sp. URMC 129 TaxID=3423407 RepID=UPI003F1D881C